MEIMMLTGWKKKYDIVWVGLILGFILPPLGFLLSKYVKSPNSSYKNYWQLFLDSSLEINKEILIFSLLPSMLAFYFLFFLFKMDVAAKGLVGVTLFVAGFSFLFLF
jgi:hypothetical protein|tara:strand:+ start:174 stop:494 length:321 start_codon:yes stop_codon:yes gene_type:complete